MQIQFHGTHSAEEAAENLLSIIKLFKERYAIAQYREITLDMTLRDDNGDDVELVDAATSEVLGVFEVYKAGTTQTAQTTQKSFLRLVVDNTK
jgi:hypothetical protein